MSEMGPGYPSRKRQRTSDGTARVTSPAIATTDDHITESTLTKSTLSDTPGMATTDASNACGAPCAHQQSLTTLLTDVQAMRQLVTCQICHNPMYEPFSLACGHTYCYSCLSQWLGHNKSCPDCRATATQQPVPSYLVREMVLIFISRTQLLPDGETSEEHTKMAREEAELVAQDKANKDKKTGGLFKGAFSQANARLLPVYDPGDGVERCPVCHWELEEAYCSQCEYNYDSDYWNDDDLDMGLSAMEDEPSSEEDLDHDLDVEDQDVFGLDGVEHGIDGMENRYLAGAFLTSRGVQTAPVRQRGRHSHHRQNVLRRQRPDDVNEDESASSSSDDESEGSMGGFINDDTIQIEESSDREGSGSDSEVEEVAPNYARGRRNRRAIIISDDDDGSSDDEAAATGSTSRRKTTPRVTEHVVIDSQSSSDGSSDHESDSEEDEEGEALFGGLPRPDVGRSTGFSPLQLSETTDGLSVSDSDDLSQVSDDESDNGEDDEEDAELNDADTSGAVYGNSTGYEGHLDFSGSEEEEEEDEHGFS